MAHEQRSAPRYPVNWQAWCIDAAGVKTRVSIVDCSDGNFGISGPSPPFVNSVIHLAIDDIGEFSCSIIWTRGNRFAARIIDDHSKQSISALTEVLAGNQE